MSLKKVIPVFKQGHEFNYLSNSKRSNLSVTEKISNQIVSLPLHSNMSNEDINYIISKIKDFN